MPIRCPRLPWLRRVAVLAAVVPAIGCGTATMNGGPDAARAPDLFLPAPDDLATGDDAALAPLDLAIAPTCSDGVKNGSETDLDCGGSCPACADGKACVVAADCKDGVCVANLCVAPSCMDGIKNGGETAVDCGGSCPACTDGKPCALSTDCKSGVCKNGICLASSCGDLVKNGMETDVDCGGGCPPCADGQACALSSDCVDLVCAMALCAAPSCMDMVKNGSETDVDCGGPCPPCATGKGCGMPADCVGGVCLGRMCASPNCLDTVKNGNETDIDCGGGTCPPCLDGRKCGGASDCASLICAMGACTAATCKDGIKNGNETDVDCGGGCPPCGNGKKCAIPGDCTSGVCAANLCTAPACNDGIKNGNETDLDCGGSCPACADGKLCAKAGDCKSGVCTGGKCQAPACNDGVKNGPETDVDCGGGCPACGAGKACVSDGDCKPNFCVNAACVVPVSCADLLRRNPNAQSGDYSILPPGLAKPVTAHCEMALDGGGWTQVLQCLPGDSCTASGTVIYNVDWLAADYGMQNANASYSLGKSLAGLITSGSFMTQVTDTVQNKTGELIYPLTGETRHFFSSGGFFQSNYQPVGVIDADFGITQRNLRLCWSPQASPFARSYQGAAGLPFLGNLSQTPNDQANNACDFGPWQAQMLLRSPAASSLTGSFGVGPTLNWGVQPYAHRIYVREAVPQPVTIVNQGGGRQWSDGTWARSCYEYLSPPPAARVYLGATGDGVYTIKPDPSLSPIDVQCDMTTDGGGWTLVQRTLWDWNATRALLTGFATFYYQTIGARNSAYRVAADLWPSISRQKDFLLVHYPRKSDTTSCKPLYYKGTGGTLSGDPLNTIFRLDGLSSSVLMIDDPRLSTTNSGPSNCPSGYNAVPWFYTNCCTTCPTFMGGYWNDAPHPMASYLAGSADLFGQRLSNACGGDPGVSSSGYYGINTMELWIR